MDITPEIKSTFAELVWENCAANAANRLKDERIAVLEAELANLKSASAEKTAPTPIQEMLESRG